MSITFVLFLASTALLAEEALIPNNTVTLEIFSDHFEINHVVFRSTASLTRALRRLKGKAVITFRENVSENNGPQQSVMAERESAARQAASTAGFNRTIGVVTNELF